MKRMNRLGCGMVLWGIIWVASLPMLALAPDASAADFPAKGRAIQIVVNYAAGGATDVGVRILAAELEKVLDTKIEVVNKPGASGQIGATYTSKAKPDGYTIGAVNLPALNVSYLDPAREAVYTRKDFIPLALQVIDPGLIAVRADSPYQTLQDVIDAAKTNPGKVTVTTTGLQSTEHFWMMRFQKLTGTQLALVHFQGSAPAMIAILGKKIDVLCGNVSDVTPHVKTGEIRVLGVMDDQRSSFLPEGVKTLKEQGIPIVGGSMRGYVLPAKTPQEIVDLLSAAMKKALASREVKEKMFNMGLTWRYMDQKQFEKLWDELDEMMIKLIPEMR
ncbi:MAG: tripartite tricarboxylate transporter substrate binding protein [Anaerolineae bacterium]